MENEKNRVGEKPNFVERARENIYFAAKDRELIEEMKADWQGVEAAKEIPASISPGQITGKDIGFDCIPPCISTSKEPTEQS